jgi:hypothetical protein
LMDEKKSDRLYMFTLVNTGLSTELEFCTIL